ncbi:oligosaccharide repeat unit polymerase [Spongiibacter tropicus]|uniref:oligosaccharide repeat unit polymerase n=1 Tax=Spongiibacter tropicus TaxID=454602 RepID=UPI002354F23B|nr:oligosaccharide repeat unit polymerase [Spongiibacter tropicus]
MGKYISPFHLWCATTAIFLVAVIFPPSYYEKVIGEPNFMFANVAMIAFYGFSSLIFFGGVGLSRYFRSGLAVRDLGRYRKSWLLPRVVAIAAIANIADAFFSGSSGHLLADIILNQEGYKIKDGEVGVDGGLLNIACIGIYWFALGVSLFEKGRKDRLHWPLRVLFISIVLSSIMRLTRGELIPFLIGIVFIYLRRRYDVKAIKLPKAMVVAAFAFSSIVAVFFLFSLARGEADQYKLVSDLMAYTIASYNRLALLLSGGLGNYYAGSGVFVSGFISFNESFNNFFGLSSYMGWPSYQELWASEFREVGSAGLNPNIIWLTNLGYLYLDLGVWAFVIIFFQGLITGYFWRAWSDNEPISLIVYPWVAFCLLFWFGTNYLLDTKFVVFLALGGALRLFLANYRLGK